MVNHVQQRIGVRDIVQSAKVTEPESVDKDLVILRAIMV